MSMTIDGFVQELGAMVSLAPTPSSPTGRLATKGRLIDKLQSLGFTVRELGPEPASQVVCATRAGSGRALVMCGHYDVEEAGEGWTTPPFTLTTSGDRIYGRGVADNLGPLTMRLLALEKGPPRTPPLFLILQGEEEIGSPLAHTLFPGLELPIGALWIEETGYFERNGSQRLLAKDLDESAEVIVRAIEDCAVSAGRRAMRHGRYLNKAFGEARCPFLTHLVRGGPYLAIGPNDPDSRIHQPNESLSLDNIPVAVAQFRRLLSVAAEVT